MCLSSSRTPHVIITIIIYCNIVHVAIILSSRGVMISVTMTCARIVYLCVRIELFRSYPPTRVFTEYSYSYKNIFTRIFTEYYRICSVYTSCILCARPFITDNIVYCILRVLLGASVCVPTFIRFIVRGAS